MRTANISSVVKGTAFVAEPYISVNFIWLSYPLSIFLVLTVFFFVTVVATRNDPLWKNSPLALLQIMNTGNVPISKRSMEKEAKDIKVRLEKGPEVWRFVPERRDGSWDVGKMPYWNP